MDFITERIAIGNRHEAADLDMLQKQDIDAVLNVAYDLDISYFDSSQYTYRFDIEYHKVGLIDEEGNQATTLAAAVYILAQLLERRNKVLVHCHAGISRSSTVVSTYLAHTEGISFDDAFSIVSAHRPEVNPHKSLRELAKSLPPLF